MEPGNQKFNTEFVTGDQASLKVDSSMADPLKFLTPFLPAPMEGYSDRVLYRRLRVLGGCGAWITRFARVTVDGICHPALTDLVPPDRHLPAILQLLGREPEKMAVAASEGEKLGFTAIDLNCGCPARVVTSKGCGAALLDDPERIIQIITAIRKATTLPLTAKIRIGRRDDLNFSTILQGLQDAGVALVTVHPRLETQGYSGTADWRYVDMAVKQLSIPVVGNGDICNGAQAVKRLQDHGCQAVMMGRGMLIHPIMFAEAAAMLAGKPVPEWSDVHYRHHLELMARDYVKLFESEKMALARLKAQLAPLRNEVFARPEINALPLLRSKTLEEYLERLPDVFR